ncbi:MULTISPECIES: hypothetical protein [unclassified Mesorhizobium]|uniref:hypothetical protein n=1 Tax=unclassified Mesorhizobium TaxID=325217 RepID=UPI0010934A00|nr:MULTISPECIES: hypothetical protein [unclassified Mesorhizobium]TGS82730.1 hypothetical protein EN818_25195 [Mesorhizobium sp. M3A.F.Ca.ET.175.01.1.1]
MTALKKLIASNIAKDPYNFDGFLWCSMSHRERGQALGVDERTIRRLIKDKSFVFDTTGNITLVRIAEPGEKPTPRTYAKKMVAFVRRYLAKHVPEQRTKLQVEKKALSDALDGPADVARLNKALSLSLTPEELHDLPDDGKLEMVEARLVKVLKWIPNLRERETRDDFGCLIGLAKVWPEGVQVEILEIVFANWREFMSGVKLVQHLEREANRKIKKADPTAKVTEVRGLFFEYPHIPTIRKYWKVALDMVTTHYQNTGKNPPPSFKALNPGLWKHLK